LLLLLRGSRHLDELARAVYLRMQQLDLISFQGMPFVVLAFGEITQPDASMYLEKWLIIQIDV
jgi:hypothetical protein